MTGAPLSVSHLTALDAPPETFVRAAAAAGFGRVGLRINPPPHTPLQWPLAGDARRVRELRQICEAAGVDVVECEGFSIRPGTTIAGDLPGLDAAAALGCRFVLAGGIEPDESRLIDRLGELAHAAAARGLRVGMEFMSWTPLRTLEDARRVHAKVGAANLGILVDFLHLARTGGSARDLAHVPADALAYAQICDATRMPAPGLDLVDEARTHRFYPGDGELPLAELVAALPADLCYTLEAPSAKHVGASLATRLNDAHERMRAFFASITNGAPATRTSASASSPITGTAAHPTEPDHPANREASGSHVERRLGRGPRAARQRH